MAQIVRLYTFLDGTIAYGSQVEYEIGQIVTAWNNTDSGVTSWTAISTIGDITMAAGKAVILKSPDGTKTIRFGLDNDGNFGEQ